jgi:hypothetical protein
MGVVWEVGRGNALGCGRSFGGLWSCDLRGRWTTKRNWNQCID